MDIKKSGSQPSAKGPTDWFTGVVRIDPLFTANEPAHARANPGCDGWRSEERRVGKECLL